MDYNHITKFLDSFKKLLSAGEGAHSAIVSVITNHTGVEIEASYIRIQGTIIRVKSSPMLRSEILIHKQGIISDLQEILPDRHFTDIQ